MEKINNNPGMFPNNRSGQNDGINNTMQALTTGQEVESPYKPGTPAGRTLRSIDTDKLDPAIGSNCKIEQEQTYIGRAESTPTTPSPLKPNRDRRSTSTDQQEHHDTKQAAKCNDTHEISTHNNDHVDDTANMTRIDRHIAASKASFDSIVANTALVVTTIGIYELSVINISAAATRYHSRSPNSTYLKWASNFGTHDST